MSGRPRKVPSYCRHKASGQAYATIAGREHYLGKFGSRESKAAYARLIAENFPGGDLAPAGGPGPETGLTVEELILRYWTLRVDNYYTKNGEPTDRQYHIRLALRPLSALYGNTLASRFGPRRLKHVREHIITEALENGRSLNRSYVNDHVGIIKRMFRWAVAEELVPVHVHQSLQTLESLHRGRDSRVQEGRKIKPVSDEHVRAVMAAASPQIRDMIAFKI